MTLSDMRVRLLNGVRAAYWGMIDNGRITQATSTLLIQSIDEAVDLIIDEPLCDWNILKAHVHFPRYYRFLQMTFFPSKLVTHFMVERLVSACYICTAFLRAHRIARTQLHEFFGESEIASLVITESDVEGEEAKKTLEDIHLTFPEVLDVVKTRQTTYSVLSSLRKYLQNLEKSGLLEKKGTLQIDDDVQESATIIAKLVLPQTFEKMASQEIRVLMAERSLMKTYTKGDIIVIHQGVIGFILEGSVKTQDAREVSVTSPAALLPSQEYLGFQSLETPGTVKTQDAREVSVTNPAALLPSQEYLGFHSLETPGADNYQVETRSRVILINMDHLH